MCDDVTLTESVYMPLLGEGTDVWRPVQARRLTDGALEIIGPMPEDEAWAYPPGSLVNVGLRCFADGKEHRVATSAISSS